MNIKIKTKSSAKKRFKLTASGKIKKKNAYLRHMLSSKSKRQKRNLRKTGFISAADTKNVKKMLPYM